MTTVGEQNQLTKLFLQFCKEKYQLSKPLYIAGGLESDPSQCTMILNGQIKLAHDFKASHEEDDDRIMFSIKQVFQQKTQRRSLWCFRYRHYNCPSIPLE